MRVKKEQPGNVFKVDMGDGFYCYGQIGEGRFYSFYRIKTKEDIPLEKIVNHQIIFTINTYKNTVLKKGWTIVGVAPQEFQLKITPAFFMQDALNPKNIKISHKGELYKAEPEDCVDLEPAAIWAANHIVDRLRDYFDGKKNIWVENTRVKIPLDKNK